MCVSGREGTARPGNEGLHTVLTGSITEVETLPLSVTLWCQRRSLQHSNVIISCAVAFVVLFVGVADEWDFSGQFASFVAGLLRFFPRTLLQSSLLSLSCLQVEGSFGDNGTCHLEEVPPRTLNAALDFSNRR